jgi:hypothetical protein
LLSVYEGRLTRIMEKQRAELKASRPRAKKLVRKPSSLSNTPKAKEKSTTRAKTSSPSRRTVGSFFQPTRSPLAATAKRRYQAATHYHFRDRSKDPEPDFGPSSTSKPHNPQDRILKGVQFANEGATPEVSQSSMQSLRLSLRLRVSASNRRSQPSE